MTGLMIKPKLTKEYISSKNILILCYSKKLTKDIIFLIKSYLIEYKHGFALFKNKQYIFNNIRCHENLGGHPFPCIIRFMSKYNYFNNSNSEFNKILDNINNVPNHKKIDLTECIHFLKSNNINIRSLNIPCCPNDILDMIVPYIDNNTNNNYKSMILYICDYNDETIQFDYLYIIYNTQQNNLEQLLIENSHYNNNLNIYNLNSNIYIKKLITNNNILTFYIDRTYSDNINGISFTNFKLVIPKILDLPAFVFHNNDKKKYILVGVILFDNIYNNKLGYSIVIRKNNNKYYHYSFNNIYIIDNDFFEQKINYNATNLFYKQI